MEHTQTVTNVSVEWILKNVNASIDGFTLCMCEDARYENEETGYCPDAVCKDGEQRMDWESMLNNKYWDFSDAFIESIMENGVKSPICIVANDRGFMQGNGHHRLAMAIYLAMDTIPVVFSFTRDYMLEALSGEGTPKSYTKDAQW